MLGRGATSVVYLAEKTGSGKRYAVKVSICDREKLRREAFLLQKFSYPGIPCAVELLESGTKSFLVMEAVNGKSIGQRMRKGERFSSREILKTGIALSGILCYLHAQNPPVFYRDLKPENIRIRVNGRVGILDLGCLWNREEKWSGAGNYSYSAPEQFRQGEIPGEESDVYAMGKLLEVMLGEKNGKHNRQEKWLRRISRMATHTERQRRIPDMKTFRRLLSVMNASGRVRRQVFKESDFYYIRKLYCP